jgi:hypothetical protein
VPSRPTNKINALASLTRSRYGKKYENLRSQMERSQMERNEMSAEGVREASEAADLLRCLRLLQAHRHSG